MRFENSPLYQQMLDCLSGCWHCCATHKCALTVPEASI